ncbi:TM1812 family CRISPR-associated protein [Dialister sp.]|uniref:TM1812 family CRISPR-associated protein n=1 Tax=Dialister sp. TaxID=1955814 RepID=UPI003F0EC9CB
MKHILLLFLSELHLKDGYVLSSTYMPPDGGELIEGVQTNEPVVKYVMNRLAAGGEHLDGIFYFATKKVRESLSIKVREPLPIGLPEDWPEGQPCTLPQDQLFQNIIHNSPGGADVPFYKVPYDEDRSTEESIRQVIAMADTISTFMDENTGEETAIYADMTGGFRYAAMMMLSVMQLLKYRGASIEGVLYSNFQKKAIEDVSEVHRMFSLLSGADEFANFGSVREIESYFKGKETSGELQSLLAVMRRFADAIRICRTPEILPLAGRLWKAMDAFQKTGHKTLQEDLFMQILYLIRKEYGSLLSPNPGALDIIRWCVDKDFLQQAMTLCTEWLPGYIVDERICYTDNKVRQKKALERGEAMSRDWKKSFIINYVEESGTPRIPQSETMNFTNNGASYLLAVQTFARTFDAVKASRNYPPLSEKLEKLFTEINDYFNDFEFKSVQKVKSRYPFLYQAAYIMWKHHRNSKTYHDAFQTFLEKNSDKAKFARQIQSVSLADISKLGSTGDVPPKKKTEPSQPKTIDEKVQSRMNQYRMMLDQGIMKTDYPMDMTLEVLENYQRIQKERNQINHASEGKGLGNEEIKTLIRKCMASLNQCLTYKQTKIN